ncbi:hypothetical protein VPNG_01315 [Cytospora leucostoma]|uniref:Uncharacterized protein n=1 Tax=Cytospora leucostoma TaxID=1230097 RepID=A0A423XKK4_9PEZI|nr:hypothetical protein VPNG_01315 [Cytospora leucostoma]
MVQTPPENAAETVGVRTDMEDRYREDTPPTEPQAQRSSPEGIVDNSEQGNSTNSRETHPRWNELSQAQREAILKSEIFANWRRWDSVHLGDWAEESWYNSVRESRRELPEWPVVIFGPTDEIVYLLTCFLEKQREEADPGVTQITRTRGFETEISDLFLLPSAGGEDIQVALQDQIHKDSRAWKLKREKGQEVEGGDPIITKVGVNGLPTLREFLFALNMPCLLDWPSPLAPEAKAHNEYVINDIKSRAQGVEADQALRYVVEAIVFRDKDILFADVSESAREKRIAYRSNSRRGLGQSYSRGAAPSARLVVETSSGMATTHIPQRIQRQVARNTGTSRSTIPETDEVAIENQEEERKRKKNLKSKKRKAQRKARQVAAEKDTSSLENQAPPGAASLESGEEAQRPEQVATLAEQLCDLPGKDAHALEEDQALGPDGTRSQDVNTALGDHSSVNAAQALVEEVDTANDVADVEQGQGLQPDVRRSGMMDIVSEASHVLEARIRTPSNSAKSVTQERSVEGSGIPSMVYDAAQDEDSVTEQSAGIVGQTDLVENAKAKSDDHTSHHSLSADPDGNILADKFEVSEEADDDAISFAEVDDATDSQAATSEQKAIIDNEAVESGGPHLRDACHTRKVTREPGTPEPVSPKPRADIAKTNSRQSNVQIRIPSKLPRVVPVMPLRPTAPPKTKPVRDTPRTPHAINIIKGEILPKLGGEAICETQHSEPKLHLAEEDDGSNAARVIAVSHTPSDKLQPGAPPSPDSVVSHRSPEGTPDSRDTAESEENLRFRMPAFSGGPQFITRRASMSGIAGQTTTLNRGRQCSPKSTEERLVDTRSKSLSPNNRFSESHVWIPKVSNVNYDIRCSVDDYNAITGRTATAPVFFPNESHPAFAPAAQPYPTYPVMGPIFPHYTGEAPPAIALDWPEQGWLPHTDPVAVYQQPFAVNQQPQFQNHPAIPPGIVMYPPPPPPMPRPRIARPIERLVRMKNIGDLAQRDIPRLLRDYQRLARELRQSGAFL